MIIIRNWNSEALSISCVTVLGMGWEQYRRFHNRHLLQSEDSHKRMTGALAKTNNPCFFWCKRKSLIQGTLQGFTKRPSPKEVLKREITLSSALKKFSLQEERDRGSLDSKYPSGRRFKEKQQKLFKCNFRNFANHPFCNESATDDAGCIRQRMTATLYRHGRSGVDKGGGVPDISLPLPTNTTFSF
ncbi:hypothetical protein J6590_079972 [Homalodisca vitripennis]|nr:hypothetical protein J6590_079972 [Homalodisca vitripennis]